jgi:hypothetical protein
MENKKAYPTKICQTKSIHEIYSLLLIEVTAVPYQVYATGS